MSERALPIRDTDVRALRVACQGLDSGGASRRAQDRSAAEIVMRHGFVRTLGGADAYISLLARNLALHRDEIDDDLVECKLRVLPAARGCIYLVPTQDGLRCLALAQALTASRSSRDLAKVGVEPSELQSLGELAVRALQQHGSMTTDVLRRSLPENSVRNLGDAGKKVGMSTPLPHALRMLEFAGRIERLPEGNRLDTERYFWRTRDAFDKDAALPDLTSVAAWLLETFLKQTGVASLQQFRQWSGLSAKDARAACDAVDHVEVVREDGSTALAVPDVEARMQFLEAARQACAMLASMDNLVHMPGTVRDLVDAPFHDLRTPSWGSRKTHPLSADKTPSYRPVLADGRIVGFWEYDPDARVAIPFCFQKPSRAAQQMLEAISAGVSSLLRDELGHAQSFSLDTEKAARERIKHLRQLASRF